MVNTLIKRLLMLIGVLSLVVIGALIYLTLILDPNSLKPELEKMAAEQGVQLRMPGDVSWSFFPNLGLGLDDVQVEGLASVRQFKAKLALLPLLSGKILVKELQLSGLNMSLEVDADGRGNWELLTSQQGATVQPEDTPVEPGALPVLAIDTIQLQDTVINYVDRSTGARLRVQGLNVEVSGLNLDGDPFRLTQNAEVHYADYEPFTLHTAATLNFNAPTEKLHIEHLDMQLREQSHLLKLLLSGELNVDQLQGRFLLEIPQFNPRPWIDWAGVSLPEMRSDQALSRVSLNMEISGAKDSWQVEVTEAAVDAINFKSNVVLSSEGAVDIGLMVESIVLDDYLPPQSEQATNAASPPGAQTQTDQAIAGAALAEEPIDLSSLEGVEAEIRVAVQSISYEGMMLDSLQLISQVSNKVVALEEFSLNMAGGYVKSSGQLDARKAAAAMAFKSELSGVEVSPLMQQFADDNRFSGVVNVQSELRSSGKTVGQLQQNASGSYRVTAAKLEVGEIDIERSACELAALVNQEPVPQLKWKGRTLLQDLEVTGGIRGTSVGVDKLQAGVENLTLQGKGKFDYLSGDFEFPLDLLFTGAADAERKCQVRDRWRNRKLPFRCEGNLDQMSPGTCLPDRKRLDDIFRDELKSRAQEKARSLLQEKLGEEDGAAVNDLLKELLKQRK